MGTNLKELFHSHPGKLLHDHLQGVAAGVRKRTSIKAAEIAAIFHDLGKINPNFQRKLKGEKNVGYSNHAYLSAFAWLCFCKENRELVKELTANDSKIALGVAAMVAHHHGNLPDFENGIFNERPKELLKNFLALGLELPLSDFLQCLLEHNHFDLLSTQAVQNRILNARLLPNDISNPLDFFLETQFGFACLIEADKRDASDNKVFNREKFGEYFKVNFETRLTEKLESFLTENSLDKLRTRMRDDAVQNIISRLAQGERVFTLSAPTGAGKTIMLLTLAAQILRQNAEFAIIYALPFLSITEQVEIICKDICHDDKNAILRIDSKSENNRIDDLQELLDSDPTKLRELLRESFSENTFDHPFIITTFVQLFETLVSNRNSTLLKLPNFARTIFLIDEIQALPPRLYIFFTALLQEFCRKFDSYAIISTATMPYLEMPEKALPPADDPKILFLNYQRPGELLPDGSYYCHTVFNRYQVTRFTQENFRITDLASEIQDQPESCLIILNTIDDTKQLYDLLSNLFEEEESILLNTHFTLNDRRRKLDHCKRALEKHNHIILISTQLIEAGVDIDFPVLYRDMCPLPNLIQSAGRCNRNGLSLLGQVYLFELKRENGKSSASLIYRNEPKGFVNFCKEHIVDTISEAGLFGLQKEFFQYVANNLTIGLHNQSGNDINMIQCINRAKFEELGKFRLIDDKYYGTQYRYYVPEGEHDREFENLLDLLQHYQSRARTFDETKKCLLALESQLRKMLGNIVTIRIPLNGQRYAPPYSEEVLGIRQLSQPKDYYSSKTGIRLDGVGDCII
ncbi:MAG: CRISPR-associated helicase Cas3' [Acidobacteriota bacterium]